MIHRLGRPARLLLVSDWTACDSLLIRRPKGTLSSDIQIERTEQIHSPRSAFQATRISSRPNVNTISGSPSCRKWWLNPCLASQLCCGEAQPPIPTFADGGHLRCN
jgi:hypothetical protein